MSAPCIRHICSDDRSELSALWTLRFGDSADFVNWYFSERYCPERSFCLEENGQILSVIHAWPMALSILSVELPALMLSGVATRPGFERRGYMHMLMKALLQDAKSAGFPLVFHKPNRLEVYASVDHLPCTETLFHTVQSGVQSPVWQEVWQPDTLLGIYQTATKRYSGCVVRDRAAMRLKLEDYRADGARLICSGGGYAVLFWQDGGWYGEEVLAVDESAYEALIAMLPDGALIKLPPDLPFSGAIRPQNVLGAADVPALLGALCGDPRIVFRIHDALLPENCGVFDGCGRQSAETPVLSFSAGELLQHLCGYMPENSPLRQYCYCVDEY